MIRRTDRTYRLMFDAVRALLAWAALWLVIAFVFGAIGFRPGVTIARYIFATGLFPAILIGLALIVRRKSKT